MSSNDGVSGFRKTASQDKGWQGFMLSVLLYATAAIDCTYVPSNGHFAVVMPALDRGVPEMRCSK